MTIQFNNQSQQSIKSDLFSNKYNSNIDLTQITFISLYKKRGKFFFLAPFSFYKF